jgi:hypothetical protein
MLLFQLLFFPTVFIKKLQICIVVFIENSQNTTTYDTTLDKPLTINCNSIWVRRVRMVA